MKKLMALLLALSLLCTLPLPATVFAEDSDFLIRNGELLVYSGAGGDVVIPEGVTAIGKSAFSFKDNVTSVTIPDEVTSIGDSAFYHCDNLTSVTIPGSVTFIGASTFADCVSLTHVAIPEGVTRLEGSTFSNCTGLISINLPDSLTFIGSSTFYMCSSLTSVSIPNEVTYIRDETFKGCSSLTSVDLPEKLTSIGDRAFHNCYNLTSVNIPDGVTSIGKYAFCNCSSLTSVGTIPDSVTSMETDVFAGCSSLISINIPSGITSIGSYSFSGCSSLSSVTFSDGVRTIAQYAFRACTGLTSIVLPDTVTSIDSSAFRDCSNLTNIKLSDNLVKLESGVFSNCTALTSITIPAKVKTISNGVFETCDNLKTISFLGSAPSVFFGLPNSSSLTAYYPIDKEESYASAKKKFSKINWVAQCYHTWGDWVITKNPTATETGTAERICGNDSTHKDIKELPALTDSTVWTQGARIEPTCENTGSQEYTSDYGTVTETLSAKGHAWGAWNVTKKPTATETGTAERICGNDSTHKDIKELPALTDSTVWTKGVRIEPTCENTGSQEYTSIYGAVTETLSVTEHSWGAWRITQNPTQTETGKAERICGNDSSHKDIKELPALTDSTVWTKGAYVAPTNDKNGSQEYTSVYGAVIEAIPALGHKFTVLQHDETKHWYKCEDCDATFNEENHRGGQATKKERATCSVCNAQYGKLLPDYALPADLKTTYGKALSDITLPTGWKWSDPSIVPTVTNNGYEAYYAIENEADYDWTNENGYDAAAKQIKLTLTVTVEKEKQKLSFEKSSINKYTTDSAFTNELTKTAVFGAVSFSSSDESVATVDNNGLITIKGTGTADITASAAETETHSAASATFTLKVSKKDSGGGGGGGGGGSRGSSISVAPGGAKKDDTQSSNHTEQTGSGSPFSDVQKSDWFYEPMKFVYSNGLMKGVSDNEFDPNGAVSRAMLVTVLYRMEKEPQAQASPFSDIAGGSYYEKAVAWANANGIVKGVSDAEFAPDESITREQMAAMIYRYAAYKKMDLSAGESTNILSYADYSDISDYAVSAMRYAAGNGIINGMTADTLSPKGISTRAQAAAVFMRVFNLFNK